MKFDCIIANPPYAQIGCDIVNKLLYEVSHEDISLLGTTAMLSKHNKRLALEYAYVADYVLNPLCRVGWVQQIILLGYKGKCKAIPAKCYQGCRVGIKPNEIRIWFSSQYNGRISQSLESILTRKRETSFILSLSDDDYEYIKNHWDDMNYIERFWWFVDRGFYKRFIEQ